MLHSISFFKLCILNHSKIDFFYSVSLRITLFHGVFGQRYWSYFTFDAPSYFPLWKCTPKFSIGIISTDIWMNLLRLRKLNHYRDLAHRLRCERIWPWHEVSIWAKKASPEKAELESEHQLVNSGWCPASDENPMGMLLQIQAELYQTVKDMSAK